MPLGEHVHAKARSRFFEICRLAVGQRRQDKQDAIGAHRPRFGDLIGVEHEILAQHRQLAGGARRDKMFGVALEIRCVGQHRKTSRAAQLVCLGDGGGIEIGPDHAARGRGHLDFGDEAVAAGFQLILERPCKSARRAGRRGRVLERGQGPRRLGGCYLFALAGADLGQYVAHGCGTGLELVMDTSCAKARLALPEDIDWIARATPALRSMARPATTKPAAAFNSTMSRSGPVSPSSMALSRAALAAGSPPFKSAGRARGMPAISGVISKLLSEPSFHSATRVLPVVVISSKPSPCTTQACSLPSLPSTSANGFTHGGA